jgi:hypothetical protein
VLDQCRTQDVRRCKELSGVKMYTERYRRKYLNG